MSPSDIREAEFLAEIAPGTWLHHDGREMQLRDCPQSLARVARARKRELWESDTVSMTDEPTREELLDGLRDLAEQIDRMPRALDLSATRRTKFPTQL